MSVDVYKAQAQRLADHLATVHGVKLKHTSVLSAIAAVHGARNWNTLIAQPKPSLLARATAAFQAQSELDQVQGLDELFFSLHPQGLHFGLNRNRTAPLTISDRDLRTHTLIVDPLGTGRQALLEYLAAQQIARGGGLLVLNTDPEDQLPALLAAAAAQAGRDDIRLLTRTSAAAGAAQAPHVGHYDLLAGLNTDQLVDRLVACLPPAHNVAAEYYTQQARHLLSVLVHNMLALREEISLKSVSRTLNALPEFLALRGRVEAAAELAPADDKLQRGLLLTDTLLESLSRKTAEGPQIDGQAFKSIAGAIVGRLAELTNHQWLADAPLQAQETLNLRTILTQQQIGYLSWPDQAGSGLSRMIQNDLFQAICARFTDPLSQRNAESPTFLVVLPVLPSMLINQWSRLFAQARAIGVGFVLCASSLEELSKAELAEVVLSNTATKVFFRRDDPLAEDQPMRKSLVGFAYSEQLKHLQDDEAVLLNWNALDLLKIRRLERRG